jgi:gas vesicle protein
MRNFGKLKSIVENALVENYKKPEFKTIIKEFNELIKNNKSVGTVYLNYGSIMKINNLSENIANEFLDISIQDIKTRIKENKKEFVEFDAWVETLDENVENKYQLLDDLVFAKTAEDFIKLLESKNKLRKMLTESKKEEKQLTETINIPIDSMFNVVADTFSNEYSNLSESQLFELKSILRLTEDELKEGIERLKNEIIDKLNTVSISDEETKNKIEETKEKVTNTIVDSISYYKLKKLSESI